MAVKNIIDTNKPLIVIAGPTASGKSALAMRLAEKHEGEIISADSRAVYLDMNIGTAKPDQNDRRRIQHWGLDLVRPDEHFTVADFKKYTTEKIDEIRSRGKTPFLVGGTGLYIDAIIFDYKFGPKADIKLREKLEEMSVEQLTEYCYKNNIKLPENNKNKRYLIRAVERKDLPEAKNTTVIENCIIVGISTDSAELRRRIEQRAVCIFQDGVVDEATTLGEKYGWDHESMTGNIYPLAKLYLEGLITYEEMCDKFTTLDWRLAKRQVTWLRRNKQLKWCSLMEAEGYVDSMLAKV